MCDSKSELWNTLSYLEEFINIFPHNIMSIKKEKRNNQAYAASTIAYASHSKVRTPIHEIKGYLWIDFNEYGVDNFLKDLSKLEIAVTKMIEAYESVKSNSDMWEYYKPFSKTLKSLRNKVLTVGIKVIYDMQKLYDFTYNVEGISQTYGEYLKVSEKDY